MIMLSILNIHIVIIISYILNLLYKSRILAIRLLHIVLVIIGTILVSTFMLSNETLSSREFYIYLAIFFCVMMSTFIITIPITIIIAYIDNEMNDKYYIIVQYITTLITTIIYVNFYIYLVDSRLDIMCINHPNIDFNIRSITNNNMNLSELDIKIDKCKYLNHKTIHHIIGNKNNMCKYSDNINKCISDISYIESNKTYWVLLGGN